MTRMRPRPRRESHVPREISRETSPPAVVDIRARASVRVAKLAAGVMARVAAVAVVDGAAAAGPASRAARAAVVPVAAVAAAAAAAASRA
jgi:hypothetical protein